MRRRLLMRACATLLFVIAGLQTGEAYLRQSYLVGDQRVSVAWAERRIDYFVSDRGVEGVGVDAFEAALQRATASWEAAPGSAITFRYAGRTAARPLNLDGRNTVGFLSRADLDGVLGVTATITDVVSGEVIEADMFLNSAFDWSVAGSGEEGRFDVESIALHEFGHMLGLNHSALGYFEVTEDESRVAAAEAVMFPFAFEPGSIAGRQLKADDIAGAAEIYPESGHAAGTAAIRAHVQLDGRDVFGAHVMAFNPVTGLMVGGFVLEDGVVTITGLQPGPYVLRLEPVDDDDVSSYFDDLPPVDLAFRNKFVERLIYAQSGTTTDAVEESRWRPDERPRFHPAMPRRGSRAAGRGASCPGVGPEPARRSGQAANRGGRRRHRLRGAGRLRHP